MKPNMAASMANLPPFTPPPSSPSRFSIHNHFNPPTIPNLHLTLTTPNPSNFYKSIRFPVLTNCINSTTTDSSALLSSQSSSPDEAASPLQLPPVKKKRKAYRRMRPGESKGITEEMRFVAMKLREKKPKVKNKKADEDGGDGESGIDGSDDDDGDGENEVEGGVSDENSDEADWMPDLDGFLKYLVESRFVFSTIERLVDESQDVSFAYFRNTGLERSERFTKDIEWLSQRDLTIPEPQFTSQKYVTYLEELAAESPPLFLSHLYNIYFSHINGGQVIVKKVSEKLLEGRELEICQWPGDPEELLKGMRDKLNALGQHWSREEKNKCLKEANKSFMYMGTLIRLIIT